jgi:Mn-dependent DtxR family transcriptional regulator
MDHEMERQKRRDKEDMRRVLADLKKRARATPREHRDIGAYAGVYSETVQRMLKSLKRKGLVKYVPPKKCETCGRQLVKGHGWLYVGKDK